MVCVMRNTIRNILFDFDGVLAESVNIKTEAFRSMYLPFGNDIANRVVNHHIENGGMSRFEKFKLYHEKWLGIKLSPRLLEQLTEKFSMLVLKGVVSSPEVKGAHKFLETNKTNIKYWIITGTPTNEIIDIVEKRGIKHYFMGIYGSPVKKDVWANQIIREFSLNLDETIFVGDAIADYNAAMKNKVKFILRETVDNIPLFKDYKGHRVKDMDELNLLIENGS